MLLRIHKNIFNKAQSLTEYTVVLSLVVAVFIGMQVYTKRAIQSVVKYSVDQIALQKDAGEEQDPLIGHLVSSNASIISGKADGTLDYTQRKEEGILLLGGTKIIYDYNTSSKVVDGTGNYVLGYEKKYE
ncbi:MAG: hypothetical protein ABH954_04730 [Candidatus Omnitrophota bacterium]